MVVVLHGPMWEGEEFKVDTQEGKNVGKAEVQYRSQLGHSPHIMERGKTQ